MRTHEGIKRVAIYTVLAASLPVVVNAGGDKGPSSVTLNQDTLQTMQSLQQGRFRNANTTPAISQSDGFDITDAYVTAQIVEKVIVSKVVSKVPLGSVTYNTMKMASYTTIAAITGDEFALDEANAAQKAILIGLAAETNLYSKIGAEVADVVLTAHEVAELLEEAYGE